MAFLFLIEEDEIKAILSFEPESGAFRGHREEIKESFIQNFVKIYSFVDIEDLEIKKPLREWLSDTFEEWVSKPNIMLHVGMNKLGNTCAVAIIQKFETFIYVAQMAVEASSRAHRNLDTLVNYIRTAYPTLPIRGHVRKVYEETIKFYKVFGAKEWDVTRDDVFETLYSPNHYIALEIEAFDRKKE